MASLGRRPFVAGVAKLPRGIRVEIVSVNGSETELISSLRRLYLVPRFCPLRQVSSQVLQCFTLRFYFVRNRNGGILQKFLVHLLQRRGVRAEIADLRHVFSGDIWVEKEID